MSSPRHSTFGEKCESTPNAYLRGWIMTDIVKKLATGFTPPFLARGIQALRHRLRRSRIDPGPPGVKGADWYNQAFKQVAEYSLHYTESSYYFLWTVLTDRILRSRAGSILDLGCGPGQFASLLHDKGVRNYRGADFSSMSIDMARSRCPYFDFVVVDLAESDLLERFSYDCVVALEFLEHVEFDLDIIRRIRNGTKFFGTVPNFPYDSHVRHFANEIEVRTRYESFFTDFTVDAFLENTMGKTFFLMEGRRM